MSGYNSYYYHGYQNPYNQSYNPFDSNSSHYYPTYSHYPNYPFSHYNCRRPYLNEIQSNDNSQCDCPECQNYYHTYREGRWSGYHRRHHHQQQSQVEEEKKIENSNQTQSQRQRQSSNQNKTQNQSQQEKKKTQDELTIEYENQIKQEVAKSTPLISEQKDIKILLDDYKDNEEYSASVQAVTQKYHFIRKVRRDGNCFYRSFIYRLFEYICMKNNKELYDKICKKITDVKDLTERNGYQWLVVEDFYNLFHREFVYCFNSLSQCNMSVRDYLDGLFQDQEKGTYLVYFVRFCIAAYLKENHFLYDVYVEGPFDKWVQSEVEAIDHEADQIQIMACVNYFDIGVKIEYLNVHKNEEVKFPEDMPDDKIFVNVLFTPGHYDILYP